MSDVLPPISEEDFQRQFLEAAKHCGWRRAHFRKVRVMRRDGSYYWETPVQADGKGFLDLVLLRGRRIVVVELKVGKNKLTPEQESWAAAWRQTPAEVYTFYPHDWEAIKKVLA